MQLYHILCLFASHSHASPATLPGRPDSVVSPSYTQTSLQNRESLICKFWTCKHWKKWRIWGFLANLMKKKTTKRSLQPGRRDMSPRWAAAADALGRGTLLWCIRSQAHRRARTPGMQWAASGIDPQLGQVARLLSPSLSAPDSLCPPLDSARVADVSPVLRGRAVLGWAAPIQSGTAWWGGTDPVHTAGTQPASRDLCLPHPQHRQPPPRREDPTWAEVCRAEASKKFHEELASLACSQGLSPEDLKGPCEKPVL